MLWVPGEPVTWGLGEKTPAKAEAKLKAWQEKVELLWAGLFPGPPLGGPVELETRFLVRSPRKDLTNLVKAAEDALKHRAFGDDDRVYAQHNWKEPVESPEEEGMEIRVRPYVGPAHRVHLASAPGRIKALAARR
jgi:Holliday junction resolvase RusA-like endonuclease